MPTKAPAAAALGGMKQRETAGCKHHNNEQKGKRPIQNKPIMIYAAVKGA